MTAAELLTTSQVADRLGLGRTTIVNMVNRNEIKPTARVELTRFGAYLFDPAEVERVAALRSKKAEAAK